MGLDISHGTFSGPYGLFNRWRQWLASEIGLPLFMMEGYAEAWVTREEVQAFENIVLPSLEYRRWEDPSLSCFKVLDQMQGCPHIKWEIIKHPLKPLLDHSDCDGKLTVRETVRVALALHNLLERQDPPLTAPEKEPHFIQITEQFIEGCYRAIAAKQPLKFM